MIHIEWVRIFLLNCSLSQYWEGLGGELRWGRDAGAGGPGLVVHWGTAGGGRVSLFWYHVGGVPVYAGGGGQLGRSRGGEGGVEGGGGT